MSQRPFPRSTPAPAQRPVAPVSPVASPAIAVELIERRRFTRPIPIAQVTECNGEEGWELWSQWSSL